MHRPSGKPHVRDCGRGLAQRSAAQRRGGLPNLPTRLLHDRSGYDRMKQQRSPRRQVALPSMSGCALRGAALPWKNRFLVGGHQPHKAPEGNSNDDGRQLMFCRLQMLSSSRCR